MRYALAPDVYMALVDGDVVLLDAKTDRYACIAACDAAQIRIGYPAQGWEESPLVSDLAASGYLTPASDQPRPARPRPLAPEWDFHLLDGETPRLRPADLVGAAMSGVTTALRLALQRPANWLGRPPSDAGRSDEAVALARRFAEAHLHLPCLARCLPRSLALQNFLARRGCPAHLVFGVRTHPFEAHCWVQAGNVVLNDTLSRVHWYTPIAWN